MTKHLIRAAFLIILVDGLVDGGLSAQRSTTAEIDRRVQQVLEKVVRWRRDIHEHPELGNRETRTAKIVADHLRSLATANVAITPLYPVTINDPKLTETMLPTLRRVAGAEMVSEQPLVTAAEDFSFFAQRAPGLFVFLGATRKGVDPATALRESLAVVRSGRERIAAWRQNISQSRC